MEILEPNNISGMTMRHCFLLYFSCDDVNSGLSPLPVVFVYFLLCIFPPFVCVYGSLSLERLEGKKTNQSTKPKKGKACKNI